MSRQGSDKDRQEDKDCGSTASSFPQTLIKPSKLIKWTARHLDLEKKEPQLLVQERKGHRQDRTRRRRKGLRRRREGEMEGGKEGLSASAAR